MRTRSITYFCVTILLSLILINSCSDSVESDPPKDNNITLTLNPVDAENDSTLSDATHYVAESSDMIGVGTDEVTRPEGTELSVRTENDGYETTKTTVTFDRNDTVDIPMTAVDTTDPDAVEVTALAIDKETSEALDDLTFSIEGEVISTAVNQVILTESQDTTLNLRVERDGYETADSTITFDKDKTVRIPLTAVDTTDPGDDEVTVTVWADDADTGEELDDLTFRIDGEIISAGVNRVILTEPKDTTIDLTIEQGGYEAKTESILFDEGKKITVELNPEAAGKITITYDVRNESGEALSGAELFIADTLVATGPDGSFELPQSSETVTVCGSADWHEDNCVELTPDADQPIDFVLARETVSVSVTPEIVGYDDYYAVNTGFGIDAFVADNTMYYLHVGDSTRSGAGRAVDIGTEIAEGVTTTIEYFAGPNPIRIRMRGEYFPKEGHPHSDNHYLNVAEGTTTVPGDADSDIQLDLEHVPACSDGVDNDFTGVADENAPGCIDYDASPGHEVGTDGWVYDPDDDVELVQVASITELYGGGDVRFVSSASGKRKIGIGGWDGYPGSLQFALSQIDLYLDNKIQIKKDGEAFAVAFVCGDSWETKSDTTGITQLVPDDPTVDGWRTSLVEGVDASFFNSGLACGRTAIHESLYNGNPPGDGNDDVVFAVPDTSGSATLVWIFEPEMVATTSHPMPALRKTAGKDVQIQDVRTRHPREALRALDPRRKQ